MIKEYQKLSEFLIENNNEKLVQGYTLGHSNHKGADALKDQLIMLRLSQALGVMTSDLKYNRVYEIVFPLAAVKETHGDSAQIISVSADLEKARVRKEYMMRDGIRTSRQI